MGHPCSVPYEGLGPGPVQRHVDAGLSGPLLAGKSARGANIYIYIYICTYVSICISPISEYPYTFYPYLSLYQAASCPPRVVWTPPVSSGARDEAHAGLIWGYPICMYTYFYLSLGLTLWPPTGIFVRQGRSARGANIYIYICMHMHICINLHLSKYLTVCILTIPMYIYVYLSLYWPPTGIFWRQGRSARGANIYICMYTYAYMYQTIYLNIWTYIYIYTYSYIYIGLTLWTPHRYFSDARDEARAAAVREAEAVSILGLKESSIAELTEQVRII